MTHIDPETLALLALEVQEPNSVERAHLQSCAECSSELAGLQRAALGGRAARDIELVEPDARVWDRIQRELALGERVPVAPVVASEPALGGGAPVSPVVGSAAAVVPGSESALGLASERAPESEPSHVASRSHARRAPRPRGSVRLRVWVPVTAGIAVLALVAGVFGSGVVRGLLPGGASERIVARALLDPFPSFPTAHGKAYLEESQDGRRSLVIDMNPGKTSTAPSDTPLREVWLLRKDAVGLISVGFLSGDDGRFSIPADVDLSQYRVVDISAEANDGNPGHSGLSIMRGDLEPRA